MIIQNLMVMFARLSWRTARDRGQCGFARERRVSAESGGSPGPRAVAESSARALRAGSAVGAGTSGSIVGNVLQWTGFVLDHDARCATPLKTAALAGSGAARGTSATVVIDPGGREGVLAVSGLPRLDAAHRYQVWLIRGAEQRGAGMFSVDSQGYGSLALSIPAGFPDFHGLGVTAEPAGGSSKPTGAWLMYGGL